MFPECFALVDSQDSDIDAEVTANS
jgi:hypothetical protein